MSSQYEAYQDIMWQQKKEAILDYTNLVIIEDLSIEEVAEKRGVSIEEVNSAFNVLKNNNPLLYSQLESKLSS